MQVVLSVSIYTMQEQYMRQAAHMSGSMKSWLPYGVCDKKTFMTV